MPKFKSNLSSKMDYKQRFLTSIENTLFKEKLGDTTLLSAKESQNYIYEASFDIKCKELNRFRLRFCRRCWSIIITKNRCNQIHEGEGHDLVKLCHLFGKKLNGMRKKMSRLVMEKMKRRNMKFFNHQVGKVLKEKQDIGHVLHSENGIRIMPFGLCFYREKCDPKIIQREEKKNNGMEIEEKFSLKKLDKMCDELFEKSEDDEFMIEIKEKGDKVNGEELNNILKKIICGRNSMEKSNENKESFEMSRLYSTNDGGSLDLDEDDSYDSEDSEEEEEEGDAGMVIEEQSQEEEDNELRDMLMIGNMNLRSSKRKYQEILEKRKIDERRKQRERIKVLRLKLIPDDHLKKIKELKRVKKRSKLKIIKDEKLTQKEQEEKKKEGKKSLSAFMNLIMRSRAKNRI